jgi:hypothetical protein
VGYYTPRPNKLTVKKFRTVPKKFNIIANTNTNASHNIDNTVHLYQPNNSLSDAVMLYYEL